MNFFCFVIKIIIAILLVKFSQEVVRRKSFLVYMMVRRKLLVLTPSNEYKMVAIFVLSI